LLIPALTQSHTFERVRLPDHKNYPHGPDWRTAERRLWYVVHPV